LEGWYSGAELDFELVAPDGSSIHPVAGKVRGAKLGSAQVLMDGRLRSTVGDGRGVLITIHEPEHPSSGTWKLRLIGQQLSATVFQCWVRKSINAAVTLSPASPDQTAISTIAASHRILSVGAYVVDARAARISRAVYSSHTEMGTETKPDVWAPGTAAWCVQDGGRRFEIDGTSAASALVTRLLAEVWRTHPELTADDVTRVVRHKVIIGDSTQSPYSAVLPGSCDKALIDDVMGKDRGK
jgi:hypothetical protein